MCPYVCFTPWVRVSLLQEGDDSGTTGRKKGRKKGRKQGRKKGRRVRRLQTTAASAPCTTRRTQKTTVFAGHGLETETVAQLHPRCKPQALHIFFHVVTPLMHSVAGNIERDGETKTTKKGTINSDDRTHARTCSRRFLAPHARRPRSAHRSQKNYQIPAMT